MDSRAAAIEKDREALVAVMNRDVWEAVGAELKAAAPQLTEHLHEMGISAESMQHSAQHAYEHLREATTLAGRMRVLWFTLATDRSLRRPLYLAALGGAVLLLFAVGLAYWGQGAIGLLTGIVGETAALLAGVGAWVALGAEKLKTVMAPVYKLRSLLDDAMRKAENQKAADIARLQSELQQRQAEYEVAVRELDQALVAVDAAKAALEEVQSGRLISRFIEERVASGDYRRHLGIVATIREDFGKLNQLIAGCRW